MQDTRIGWVDSLAAFSRLYLKSLPPNVCTFHGNLCLQFHNLVISNNTGKTWQPRPPRQSLTTANVRHVYEFKFLHQVRPLRPRTPPIRTVIIVSASARDDFSKHSLHKHLVQIADGHLKFPKKNLLENLASFSVPPCSLSPLPL